MTSGQEMERVYSYNPKPALVQFADIPVPQTTTTPGLLSILYNR